MNIRQLIYKFSPSFIKRRFLRNLRKELRDIDDMLIPSKMVAYEDYLASLYDFSLNLPVEFIENFSLMKRKIGKFQFESSQRLLGAVIKAVKTPELFNDSGETVGKEMEFWHYYSNQESMNEVIPYVIKMLRDLRLFRMQNSGDLTVRELKEIENMPDAYLVLLSNRFMRKVLNDYTEILDMILVSNLGGQLE